MSDYDLVIKNGTIVDGTGAPRIFGDLAIRDGVIERMGGEISAARAARVIEAEGKIVAPGIIDPHTHYDAQIHWDPYCTNSSWHGTTSVVVGNCGFGFSPCKPDSRERYMLMMEKTEQVPYGAMHQALGWDWETFPDWIEHMKRTAKGVNVASYMPLNSLMIYVMGYEAAKSRGATSTERQRMRDLLNEAMDAGAIGFALSHLRENNSHKDCDGTPMPTDMMEIEDAYYLAEVLRERNEGVIQALVEVPGSPAHREVVENLACVSGRTVLHNIIATVEGLPEYHRDILRWLDETEAQGLNIYSQAFAFDVWAEFTATDYTTWDHVPLFDEFSGSGDADARALKAADPAFLARAREVYTPELMQGTGAALHTLVLVKANGATSFEKFEGQLLGDIVKATGDAITDVFFGIVAESGAMADFRATESTSTNPEYVGEILDHRRTIPGTSDGGAHVKFVSGGHYGTDNILSYVRNSSRYSLEHMHSKLSHLPARILGLNNRGALLEGFAADLYIYDYESLGYNRDSYDILHDLPDGDWRRVVKARGVEWVIVNGEPIFRSGISTEALPGRLLSNQGAAIDERLGRAA